MSGSAEMNGPLKKKLSASKSIQKKARTGNKSTSLDALGKDVEKALNSLPCAPPPDVSEEIVADATKIDASPKSPPAESPSKEENDSFEQEYEVRHPTGEKMRDKVRDLLSKALEINASAEDKPNCMNVAAAIENAMFKKFNGNGQPYKTKYRSISFNLKDTKNQKLRDAVLKKELAPSRLLEMTSEELANEELKKTREKVHEKMTRDAMPYNKPAASTNMFRCGKCKERKCTYFQMQTRSADEPLTTFVNCVNCGNRWRF